MSFLEYAPAPESTAILNLKAEYGLFIDGEFVDGRGEVFDTISPATEEVIARIAHEGLWDSQAGDALYFHAKYVHPSWSRTKIARATIDTHIFYR